MTNLEICPACNGSGVGVADTTCGTCNGSGGVPHSSRDNTPVAVEQSLEWRWWAGRDEEEYRLAGPCMSREQAIGDAYGNTEPGDTIYLIEAVAGEFNDYDGLFMFTHMRNHGSVIREEDAE